LGVRTIWLEDGFEGTIGAWTDLFLRVNVAYVKVGLAAVLLALHDNGDL
jgi:hypothetical protein